MQKIIEFRNPNIANYIVLAVFFLIPLLLVHILNLDTLESVLDNHWQILDLAVLKSDPINSIFYLHYQPPLLNSLIFILLNIPGSIYENMILLNCIFITIIALILFRITSHYLKSERLGFTLTLIYVVSPPILLSAAYPFYVLATSMGYACLVYSFFIIYSNRRISLFLFLFSIIYLYYLRTSFSLPAIVILSTVYLYYSKSYFSKLRSFLFVFAYFLILLLPIKNFMVYDFFGTTSGYPANLMLAFGVKAPLGPNPSAVDIIKEYPDMECKYSNVPADTNPAKANGHPNMNSCFNIEYGRMQMPLVYSSYDFLKHGRNVMRNIAAYFDTPDEYYFLSNRDEILKYTFIFNIFLLTLFFKYHQIRLVFIFLFFYLIKKVYEKKDFFQSVLLLIFLLHFFSHILTDGSESRRHVVEVEFIFYIIASFVLYKIKLRLEKNSHKLFNYFSK